MNILLDFKMQASSCVPEKGEENKHLSNFCLLSQGSSSYSKPGSVPSVTWLKVDELPSSLGKKRLFPVELPSVVNISVCTDRDPVLNCIAGGCSPRSMLLTWHPGAGCSLMVKEFLPICHLKALVLHKWKIMIKH